MNEGFEKIEYKYKITSLNILDYVNFVFIMRKIYFKK
jgi:hypothetical protein